MNLHYFQHVPFEGLAKIEDWLIQNNLNIRATGFYDDFGMIDIDQIDWLIIMGGPMNVYEDKKYPWLKKEKIIIENCIKKGKKILGICLGAQLIADVLGAKVYKNKFKEIGWFPVLTENESEHILKNCFPDNMPVFQWHGDTFDIPEGALKLAYSEACQNQGFIYEDRVIGLQFHIESTLESVKKLVTNCRDEIVQEKFIQDEELIIQNTKMFQNKANKLLYKMLDVIKEK